MHHYIIIILSKTQFSALKKSLNLTSGPQHSSPEQLREYAEVAPLWDSVCCLHQRVCLFCKMIFSQPGQLFLFPLKSTKIET